MLVAEQAQAEREMRAAREAELTGQKHVVAKAREQAEAQRKAAQAALRLARESVELARVERERAEAGEQAVQAAREQLYAEGIAHSEAKLRASLACNAAALAEERRAAEEAARRSEEARRDAEASALEAAQLRAAAEAHAESELQQAEAAARELALRLTQRAQQYAGWRVLAKELLGAPEAPRSKVTAIGWSRPRPLIGMLAATGVAAFAVWTFSGGLATETTDTTGIAAMQARFEHPMETAVAEPKLRISYQLSLPESATR